MKYDLGGGSLSSGNYSTATETACFDGVLFSVLRKRLSNDCGDFSFLFWCHLVEKAQQMAVAQTTWCRFQVQSSEQIEKSDANAICAVLCSLDSQINICAHFFVFQNNKSPPDLSVQTSCQTHDGRASITEQQLVSTKPSEIDMKNDISRPSVGVLVFSFQLAITPPL